jgi:hypothetical protein
MNAPRYRAADLTRDSPKLKGYPSLATVYLAADYEELETHFQEARRLLVLADHYWFHHREDNSPDLDAVLAAITAFLDAHPGPGPSDPGASPVTPKG